MGFSNLLISAEDFSEKEQYHLLIRHNNELLLNIINDVFDISKIESGDIELHLVWFNLSDIVKETVAGYVSHVPAEVELLATYPEQDYFVELDSTRVKQVLNYILSNALKYTSKGTVTVSYKVCEGSVEISVVDTGCGIPENKTDKIFERFEKLDPYVQGAGLGLSISRLLVDKMGGRIEVDSTVGVGSTFRVILPCRMMLIEELISKGIE